MVWLALASSYKGTIVSERPATFHDSTPHALWGVDKGYSGLEIHRPIYPD